MTNPIEAAMNAVRDTVDRLTEECTDADGNVDWQKFQTRLAETADQVQRVAEQLSGENP